MDIKIACPNCKTKLIVEDDLVGQLVACDECNEQFTVEKPIENEKKSATKPDRVRKDEVEEKPRSRRLAGKRDEGPESRLVRSSNDDDYEDYVPVRRRPKPSSSNLAPMIFGSLLVVMTLLVGVGLFFAFGFGTSTNRTQRTANGLQFGNAPLPSAGPKRYILSNPQWVGAGPHFTIAMETVNGQPDPTNITLRHQSVDGSNRGTMTSPHLSRAARTTVSINRIGFGRVPTNVWVEDPRFPGITASNILTLD